MAQAKLVAAAPVLLVRDVVAAANHYRDAMGQLGDHSRIVPHWTVSPGLWDMYFYVDNVDALFAEFTARGATIEYGLCDQPYGCREFGARDLDGHDVGFGQDILKP